jgi:hypothetical protein
MNKALFRRATIGTKTILSVLSISATDFQPNLPLGDSPVFHLLDIRREPGLMPFGYQFVSLEDSFRCAGSLIA